MQTSIKIPSLENFFIYGTLNSKEKNNDKLIIFVHGLSGNQHEHQYFLAKDYFCDKGYDTFRFDFYSGKKDSRQISNSSISTHVTDLEHVIKYFDKKYENIYLVGHSLGCLVIMNSDIKNVKKIIHWDPSYGFNDEKEKGVTYDKNLDKYIIHWGLEILINKEMLNEWKAPLEDLEKYSQKITKNSYFIFAGLEDKYTIWKDYIGNCKCEIVKNASHRFIEEGLLNELYEKTYNFLNNIK